MSQKGMMDKMRQVRRRTKQQILQTVGKAENTKDPIYEELVGKFGALDKSLGKIYKDMKAYGDAMKVLVTCSSALSESLCEFYDANARLRSTAMQAAAISGDIDSKSRLDFEDGLQHRVMGPIREFLVMFPTIKRKMEARERLVLDYDSYRRKVKTLRDAPKHDTVELDSKETKLRMASEAYSTAHDSLTLELSALEEHRADIVDVPFVNLLSVQLNFFRDVVAQMEPLEAVISQFAARPPFTPETLAQMVEAERKEDARYSSTFDNVADSMGGMSVSGGAATSSYVAPAAALGSAAGASKGSVRALYAYAASSPEELTFNASDVIRVLEKDDSGWWKGEVRGMAGIFPVNYTEPCADPMPSSATSSVSGFPSSVRGGPTSPSASFTATPPSAAAAGPRCKALFDYDATDHTELSFRQGDIITVLKQDASGWWEGQVGGRSGLFPSNYTEQLPS